MILKIKNLKYLYNENNYINYANFEFQKGITVIEGISGSGKTTLLYLFARIKNYIGSIYLNDIDINRISLDVFYKNIVSVVFQNGVTSSYFTLYDYLILFQTSFEINKQLLDELQLINILKQPIQALSGGQKYRVALFIALLKKTPLILLDEPTAHLDLKMSLIIINILQRYLYNHIILVASHDQLFLSNQSYSHYKINQNIN